MRRFTASCIIALACGLGVSACGPASSDAGGGPASSDAGGGPASSTISQASNESVEGLVLHSGVNTLVAIASDVDPLLGDVVKLGVFDYEQATKEIKLSSVQPVVTVLTVRQVIDGEARYSIFKVTTSRQLVVALNGQFVEYISAHGIMIDVAPNTASTIVVTVKDQTGLIYRKGTVDFSFTPPQLLANLDTGQNASLTNATAELRILSSQVGLGGRLNAENGTVVSRWTGTTVPTLANCASLPAKDWSTGVVALFHLPERGMTWCVHTSEHRYGLLVSNVDAKYEFLYLLWKDSSDL